MITDDLAKDYNWKGQKNKKAFKDLGISKIVIGKYSLLISVMTILKFLQILLN